MKVKLQVVVCTGLLFFGLVYVPAQSSSAATKPVNAVTWWGDSLSAGAGGKGVSSPSELSKLLKIPVLNKGVGGEGSSEIAIRSGAKTMTIRFWGEGTKQGLWTKYKVLPSANLLQQGSNVIGGNVKNCLALLKYEAGSYTTSLFKCKQNFSNLDAKFEIAGLEVTNTKYQIIWSGRNNAGDSTTVMNDITSMIKRMKKINSGVKIYVLGVINGSGEGLGTGTYTAITTLNDSLNQLDATYVDIRRCLINQALDREKLIPNLQDLSDIENDLVPSQLRSDGIHLNAFGYHAVAICVRDAIKASS